VNDFYIILHMYLFRYMHMYRMTLLFGLFSISLSTMFAQQTKHVDSKTFYNLVNSGSGIVLDVRTSGEFSQGHIENSTLISINDPKVLEKLSLLQKERPIYVYCLTGSRSRVVADYLSKNGYAKVYNLQRGILEWQRYGYKITRGTAPVANAAKSYSVSEFNQLLKSNNVVLVDFNAPWCAPCKQMAPIIADLKQNYMGKAHVEKIDVQSNQVLQKVYNVQSIPGLLLFKDGKQVWKHTGTISYNELSRVLNQHL
jgi:thioredoxin 1